MNNIMLGAWLRQVVGTMGNALGEIAQASEDQK